MSAIDLFRRHLANVGKSADAQDLSIYSESVRFEFPYAPEGHTRELSGHAGVSRFLENIGKFTEGFTLGEPNIREVTHGVIAEYHGDAVFKDSQKPYSQDYVAVVTVENDQITVLREYYDGIRVLRALGEMD